MATIAVVAEKPSVARDIAEVLGANKRGEGYQHGQGYVVTWAFGHLVGLAQPHEINPAWKAWRADSLPLLPKRWPLVVQDQTAAQFEIIRRILTSDKVDEVICATDAGREGELIFRFIYEAAGSHKPVRRLWISSLTPDAIRRGFGSLRAGAQLDGLGAAARGRAQADWLVGMNLSRAYTLAQGDTLSVGRVQTPTLALVVQREQEIRAFVPLDYLEIWATFAPQTTQGTYRGAWYRPGEEGQARANRRLPFDGEEAGRVVARVKQAGAGAIESINEEKRKLAPPLLYDLTELQRHANRLYGFSAAKTLEVAQRLYEAKKLLSYPRTDSRHLSADIAGTLNDVVKAISPSYAGKIAEGSGARPLGKRFVDDDKVSDHHALLPTLIDPRGVSLDADEQRLYDLVCRRLLSAWHDDHIWSTTTVITAVPSHGPLVDRFHTVGTAIVQVGWKVLEIPSRKPRKAPPQKGSDEDDASSDDDEQDLPAGLVRGQAQAVREVVAEKKQTRPPRRLTEGTLLTAMETAGKTLDDKELSQAMKDCGLGTPSTRASMIETLLARDYIVREGKALAATEKGISLIDRVHPDVKSPAMTGEWESKLRKIERGELALGDFMQQIEEYVREVVGKTLREPHRSAPALVAAAPPRARVQTGSLSEILRTTFGHERFRPHQEEVCKAALEGKDLLLVMPTGAGKSLCYQLPGLARGGTTLVVSPLIALMEDQVAKLRALGLRAERIHSGRERAESRQVCADYLSGQLDFLYIAPERLGVPGFPEMLARRKPSLIAIDEAHCISHWGHDFRPDYRRLGERLPMLRPAPVLALTATATPRVQDDIVQQLGLTAERRFIHGFRRTNLAIEVVEVPKPDRTHVVTALLKDPARRPAILYSPTRKDAEALAAILNERFPAAAYHAGMPGAARDKVQTRFLDGSLEVVVATIAFGMGVDKADVRTVAHLALPRTLEGYYQEIGRAGRDGEPSRAVLLHSFVDRKTIEFLRERSYPDVEVLAQIFAKLTGEGQAREQLARKLKSIEGEVFDHALEKLWMHGGARIEPDETVRKGHDRWRPSYEAQIAHQIAQEEQMARFAQAHGCRMLHLVRHFGDEEDAGERCGVCDACAPGDCAVQRFGEPDARQKAALLRLVAALKEGGEIAAGTLFRESGVPERRDFELLVSGLVRANLASSREDTFEKDGKQISFQRLSLTARGRSVTAQGLGELALPGLLSGLERAGRGKRGKKRKSSSKERAPRLRSQDEPDPGSPELIEALKSWRLGEARKKGVPAFRILTDKVLLGIAATLPRDEEGLLSVAGIGPALARKYAAEILSFVARHR